nr:glutathione S-transferase T3-like [Ipomoea batatas]
MPTMTINEGLPMNRLAEDQNLLERSMKKSRMSTNHAEGSSDDVTMENIDEQGAVVQDENTSMEMHEELVGDDEEHYVAQGGKKLSGKGKRASVQVSEKQILNQKPSGKRDNRASISTNNEELVQSEKQNVRNTSSKPNQADAESSHIVVRGRAVDKVVRRETVYNGDLGYLETGGIDIDSLEHHGDPPNNLTDFTKVRKATSTIKGLKNENGEWVTDDNVIKEMILRHFKKVFRKELEVDNRQAHARTVRTASYSIEEDQLLCHVYVDICQDKVTGHYHAGDAFWTRVMNAYHEALPAHVGNTRPLRSIQTRMQTIMTAIAKLRGCIVQVENLNPSGASEQDIIVISSLQTFKIGFCIACIRKSKIFQSPLKLHNTSSQCYKSLPLAYAYLFLVVGGSRLGRWRRWAAGLEAAAGGLGCRLGEADGRWRAGLSGRRLVVGWVEAGGRGVVDRRTTYAIRREERARDVWGQGLRSCFRVGYLAGL